MSGGMYCQGGKGQVRRKFLAGKKGGESKGEEGKGGERNGKGRRITVGR
jgi:hypothetical protein